MPRQLGRGGEVEQPEAARVAEADRRPAVGDELDMVVRPRRRRQAVVDRHAAGHAEMGDQHGAVVERREHELGAPAEPLDPTAAQPRDEIRRHGEAEVRAPLRHLRQHAAFQLRPQAAADGLDLRKLWHGRNF